MNFNEYVNNLKRKIMQDEKENLFVCIGTTKVLWDSIGPLVGSYLKSRIGKNKVVGDIRNNICSKLDLLYYYPKIRNKYIIAIDTAILNEKLSDGIFISNKPTIMGLALNQNKGEIGDVSIKIGISKLEDVNVQYVNRVAKFISDGICEVVKYP